MIPKTFHRVWFGNTPLPEKYEEYWAAWQRQYPDFEFVTWRDVDAERLPLTHDILRTLAEPVRRADVARYEILLTHGGIYLDCDVMPYNRFDIELLNNQLLVCNESESTDYCSIGFIAAEPGHPSLRWAVDELQTRELGKRRPNVETGPYFFREALRHGTYKQLPKSSFYPYLYDEPYSKTVERDLSRTYGIHIWGRSWLADGKAMDLCWKILSAGDIFEAERLLGQNDNPSPEAAKLLDFCQGIRSARIAALAAATHPAALDKIKIRNNEIFHFLKLCFFLTDKRNDVMAWQIGAADGVLVDPVRPLFANKDISCVLLEPNQYLFSLLEKNYKNNDNMKLVNAALGEGAYLTLHAINPDKVRERGLPDWACGISSAFLDRNAIGGLTIDKKLTLEIHQCIETIDVPMVDVDFLLELHGNQHPDIIVVDVEGMDFVVVELIFRAGIRPLVLQFETQCLPRAEKLSLIDLLKPEYVIIPFGNDSVACRADFFMEYSKEKYVENGVNGIFHGALAIVAP